jgi:hypothetical protein
MALTNALSLKDLLDYIDANTIDIRVEHQNKDQAGAALVHSDFVWIPRFKTAGFPAGMIAKGFKNDVELGGFGLAKYPMSHPLSTMSTKGGNDGANWGGVYAAMSLPMKCAWTYVDWSEALIACEAMNQETGNGMAVDDIASSTSTSNGADGNSIIDSALKTKITGDNLEISRTEGGSTTKYYRRIKKVEYHNDKIIFTPSLPYGLITALAGDNNDLRYTRKGSQTNYIQIVYTSGGASGTMSAARSGAGSVGDPYVITVTFYDDDNLASTVITKIRADADCHAIVHVENAPGNSGAGAIVAMGATSLAQFNTISGDAYTTKKFTLWGPYEWATMKYLCAMHYAVNHMDYPKGNNNYGRDVDDADEFQYYGRLDPDYDDGSHAICKVLTGTGPLSWRHNGKPSGVWGLNGNVWEWCKGKMGGASEDHIIDAGFMGEGLKLPASNNHLAGLATVGDCGVPDLALPGSVGSQDADFDKDYYFQDTGARAFLVGDFWTDGAFTGLFCLAVSFAASSRDAGFGFRAVL